MKTQRQKPVTYSQAVRLIADYKKLSQEVGASESSRLEFACVMTRELYKRALEVSTRPDVLEMIEQHYAALVAQHEAALCEEVIARTDDIYVCELKTEFGDFNEAEVSPGLTA